MVQLFNAKDMPRKLLSEERLDRCCQLIKLMIRDSLVALCTQSIDGGGGAEQRSSRAKRGKKRASESDQEDAESLVDDGVDDEAPRQSKPLIRAVFRLCESKVIPLMEITEQLIRRLRFDDRLILALSSTALATLPLQCEPADLPRLQTLHQHSLNILQSLFGSYEEHRYSILDDVFGVMLKLPTAKRHLRTFPLNSFSRTVDAAVSSVYASEGVGSIQTVSALILLLVQSTVTADPSGPDAVQSPGAAPSHGHLRKAYSAVAYFVKQLLHRCQRKEEGSEYRTVLANFVDDLLAACLMPEWPAAETVLHLLSTSLTHDLMRHAKDREDDAALDASSASHYLAFALDLIGKVCTRIRAIVRDDREFPVVLPAATEILDPSAGPMDSGQVTGCRCNMGPRNLMLVHACRHPSRRRSHPRPSPPPPARTAIDATGGSTRSAWASARDRSPSSGSATTAASR
jgi:hypothetical protein